jgi:hypothetical protein
VSFNTVDITTPTTSNQGLSIVGGYTASSGLAGAYLPAYEVTDSSTLTSYPLTKGQASQFPNNPKFTDKNTGQSTYYGTLRLRPIPAVNTVVDAQAWFSNADTKTGLLILESVYHQ